MDSRQNPPHLSIPNLSVRMVTKRSGELQYTDTMKIYARLEALSFGLDMNFVNLELVVNKVIEGMYDGVKTTVLDELAAETCAYMNLIHPHYSLLAARIAVNNLHKETRPTIKYTAEILYNCKDKAGNKAPLLADDVYKVIMDNHEEIEKRIDYKRDYTYDFFGFKTLERAYLLRVGGRPVYRPQHMLMRVSIGIHKADLSRAFYTYDLMSNKWFTHATPTLFNSGTPFPQMSSCFLLTMRDDSIPGIYDTLGQCARISKSAGGIGLAVSDIRSKDSYIRGTNGNSNGIVPMLRVFNDTARYVDQGGGKRKGSFAIYLEPWHSDIFEFLDLKKNTGKEENRARDLFYGLWIPDLFMRRVVDDGMWTLMCPNECPGLTSNWGKAFYDLYEEYERDGKGRKTIKARELWQVIVDSQIETGTPYMLYKDSCNRKSNQQNLGTIKCSNLCTYIVQYTSKEYVAVCNLASVSLPKYVEFDADNKPTFNLQKLIYITRIITRNLNLVIDNNHYPIEEARYSNMKNRPVGIGVQGLADAFQKMRIPFESPEAEDLNYKIFYTIYYGAVMESIELARQYGPYESFAGSPASKGLLQFDLWDYKPYRCGYDWDSVKKNLLQYGMRNSLLVAPMPTASTSQILGNNESFEPYTSNVYTRRVLAGEFVCINTNIVYDLIRRNLWTPEIKNKLLASNGSIQNIPEVPEDIKDLYKTVWEISQRQIINLAVGRSPFIDQSQSLNIHLADPNYSKMCSMHFFAWEKGLKTGMYYLRSRPAADPIKFTVDVEALLKTAGHIEIEHTENGKKMMRATSLENIESMDVPQKKLKTNDGEVKACPMRKKGAPVDEYCLACGS